MNKMVKGAVVTGIGIALLLGGGGTLAVWNASAEATQGSVVSGDLDLTAETGAWMSNLSGAIADITEYQVIPGETLTFTQKLDVQLEGDELAATLAVTGVPTPGEFLAKNVTVTGPLLTNATGAEVPKSTVLTEANDGVYTASTTFAFLGTTTGRDSVNATYDFSSIGYKLEQLAPATN